MKIYYYFEEIGLDRLVSVNDINSFDIIKHKLNVIPHAFKSHLPVFTLQQKDPIIENVINQSCNCM